MNNMVAEGRFCADCGISKMGDYCAQCQRNTKNLYKMSVTTGVYGVTGMSVDGGIKRGDLSWAYFPIAYGIILTLLVGIVSLIDIFAWWLRIIIAVFLGAFAFWLCFFNSFFRRNIVMLFTKSKDFKEKI